VLNITSQHQHVLYSHLKKSGQHPPQLAVNDLRGPKKCDLCNSPPARDKVVVEKTQATQKIMH
jgi:hypothetical protein